MATAANWDVAILGSGFAGSLTALLLHRLGLRVGVVDRAVHPRFAIGESSTPVANMVLGDLACRYNLPRLLPLTKWGPWQRAYPQLGCGLKRGFSYFRHESGKPFAVTSDHRYELLVAASSDDEHSDTHWLRADVDAFLANEVLSAGIPLWEGAHISCITSATPDANHISQSTATAFRSSGWTLEVERGTSRDRISAHFVIDGTGEAGLVPHTLGLRDRVGDLHTHSRTIFSHFQGVADMDALLLDWGGSLADHPFSCDDAAQHHLFDAAWAWVLRFAQGTTSVGVVMDPRVHPGTDQTPEAEWQAWLDRYPSWQSLLQRARIVTPPGRLIRTGRLQRCWETAAGTNWALLPHTAGFIDPLHSTGIAHSLCGVERLVELFQGHWERETFSAALREYDRIWRLELAQMDRLVHGCFLAFDCFPALVAYSHLYFAAATMYERRRLADPTRRGAFLLADDPEFAALVSRQHERLMRLRAAYPRSLSEEQAAPLIADLRAELRPYDHVGLLSPGKPNMYAHTALPAE